MPARNTLALNIAAVVAVIFGLLTVISGGRALFGDVDMGAVVSFVLWFNCKRENPCTFSLPRC